MVCDKIELQSSCSITDRRLRSSMESLLQLLAVQVISLNDFPDRIDINNKEWVPMHPKLRTWSRRMPAIPSSISSTWELTASGAVDTFPTPSMFLWVTSRVVLGISIRERPTWCIAEVEQEVMLLAKSSKSTACTRSTFQEASWVGANDPWLNDSNAIISYQSSPNAKAPS
jgi:hypothetical protein